MALPQTGIFALGNLAHTYLELRLTDPARAGELVRAVADLSEPRTTMGGVNLVTGFRPELWAEVAPDRAPLDVHGFNDPVVGPGGYAMPATQRDLVLWIAGASFDIVFDAAIEMVAALRELATLDEETVSWSYHRDRDPGAPRISARSAPVAQWIEQPPPKRKVAGSTPAWGTTALTLAQRAESSTLLMKRKVAGSTPAWGTKTHNSRNPHI